MGGLPHFYTLMVRIIIPQGETLISSQSGTAGYPGPLEIVSERFNLTHYGMGYVDSGEYMVWSGEPTQTLPYLREELTITLPLSLVMAALVALTWLRKHV